MSRREAGLACLLAVAAVLVVRGVALMHVPSGWVAAGVATATLGWLLLGEVGE